MAQAANNGIVYLFGGVSPDYENAQLPIPSVDEIAIGFPNHSTAVKADVLPSSYSLAQNYPNPFNPATVISYQLPTRAQVKLKVYDVLGREVATLVNEEQPAGIYKFNFDGGRLSSGVYFYRLISSEFTSTKKMILAK